MRAYNPRTRTAMSTNATQDALMLVRVSIIQTTNPIWLSSRTTMYASLTAVAFPVWHSFSCSNLGCLNAVLQLRVDDRRLGCIRTYLQPT